MIAVDTNVLARLFVDDGSPERGRATAFFAAQATESPVFVSIVVLVEFMWLLRSRYEFSRAQTLDALTALLRNAGFMMEREEIVVEALDRSLAHGSGFTDELVAALGASHGCKTTVTFDRDAARRIPGMELLK